ncbi:MAG: rRNA maturation RNase YbeY [bacterium]
MLTFEISRKSKVVFSNTALAKICRAVFEAKKMSGDYYFSLAFIGDKEMTILNETYRGKNGPTDVLSFAELDEEDEAPKIETKKYLGEIIIDVEQAKRQAKEDGKTIKKELNTLAVHGLAHLLGYEHENVSKAMAKKMTDFEAKVLDN